jgi:hypothetical protein
MTRRCLIFGGAFAAGLRADAAGDAWNLMASMATSLADGDSVTFLSAFDPAIPHWAELQANVYALLRLAVVETSIDLVNNEGDDSTRRLETDWLLMIKLRSGLVAPIRRQQRVRCRVEKQGRRWRVAAFDPLSLFQPPAL